MKQFIAGMLVASLGWGGLVYAAREGMIDLFGADESTAPAAETAADDVTLSSNDDADGKKRPRKRSGKRRRRSSSAGSPMPVHQYDLSEGVVGDALDPDARQVEMGAGAEDQLSPSEIEQGIDRVFRGIERCLLLLPPDAPSTGKILFGMHIASSGQVTKVNLKGPRVMIQGDTGACLRKNIQSIRFRRFDGPAMVVHYPVTFD